MDDEAKIRLVIYKRKYVFDDLQVSLNHVEKYPEKQDNDEKKPGKIVPVKFNRRGCNAYLASAIVDTMFRSSTFCQSIFRRLSQLCKTEKANQRTAVFLKLLTPKRQFLDYKWNEKVNDMIIERQNIEYAMSWLSTLGGAFSSLGDCFEHCAEMAGKISIEQFKLAMRLGDPSLVARCKLYAALSLIQRNSLNYPKKIIQDVFSFAKEINDVRLQRMCHGIWAKLKYFRSLRKSKRKLRKTSNRVK